ncbi:MAG: TIM-barrel domain-containing protein [Sarcina sp.]
MDLAYREALNQQFKNYKDNNRIYNGFQLRDNKVIIDFTNIKLKIVYFNDEIVKVFFNCGEEFESKTNAIILKEKPNNLKVIEDKDLLIISGRKIKTVIKKKTSEVVFLDKNNNTLCEDFQPTFKDENGNIYISKVNNAKAYYGLGEKGGSLNKKGTYTENYNTDDPDTDDDYLYYYKTIPFYVAKNNNSKPYGIFFDNSFRSYFDMGKSYEDRIFFGAVGGQANYYFILGDNIKEVVTSYSELTGKMDMPPLWSLGYQQNRFSYFSQDEMRDVVNNFEKKGIPLDVIYFDIDYMDGFRVMTFKKPNFDKVKELIEEFHKKGIKVITILDPGVKEDTGNNYGVYERGLKGNHFTKKADGEVFIGAVWPGDSAFPDFSNKDTREWWKEELKSFIDEYKIDGIWNDMNEPCVFNTDSKTISENCIHNGDFGVIEHKEFHNRYGFEMSRCSHEAQRELYENKREFSMTRATYAGGQRYSSIWTGDNSSKWDQMRMSISMNANLGISGFSFVGNDVGGFGLDCTEELFIRWMELGVFLPIFRNHSNMYTRRQEPWAFGARAEQISKEMIELRYELMPYIYNSFYHSYKRGLPVFRPLVMEFEDDENLNNIKEEFIFGDSVLVAPVLYEGERSKVVYFPEGNWYDYKTNKVYEGKKRYKINCKLNEILFFVKEGSIIPTYNEKYSNMENRPSEILFKIYGDQAKVTYYEDDGNSMDYKNGVYNLYEISASDKKVDIKEIVHNYKKGEFEFQFN